MLFAGTGLIKRGGEEVLFTEELRFKEIFAGLLAGTTLIGEGPCRTGSGLDGRPEQTIL